MPNVLSPRDLVFRPDNMDETVPHIKLIDLNLQNCNFKLSHYFFRHRSVNTSSSSPGTIQCPISDLIGHNFGEYTYLLND